MYHGDWVLGKPGIESECSVAASSVGQSGMSTRGRRLLVSGLSLEVNATTAIEMYASLPQLQLLSDVTADIAGFVILVTKMYHVFFNTVMFLN